MQGTVALLWYETPTLGGGSGDDGKGVDNVGLDADPLFRLALSCTFC